MEAQHTVNLSNGSDNENSKFATNKWYFIDSQSKGKYSHKNKIKFLTNSVESSLCDYSDAYILVTGNNTVTRTIAGDPVQRKQPLNAATQVVFKNCAPFEYCRTGINDTVVDYASFIYISMPMYNLIEYNDNYSDTLGSFQYFKGDEIVDNANVTNEDNDPLFKYKLSLICNTEKE